jgi:hypothetical protein
VEATVDRATIVVIGRPPIDTSLAPPATGIATERGIGSVGKEIGMVDLGITTFGPLFFDTGGGG